MLAHPEYPNYPKLLMSLKESLMADMKAAMRDRQVVRLETIRLLRAAIQRKEVDEQIQLDDQGVLRIIQKMVKQCTEICCLFGPMSRPSRSYLASRRGPCRRDKLPSRCLNTATVALT
ncbi:GatB/YqeY domain-containing protein [Candidatus Spongiihabitans sp.]|uniref:GatB/YqeY domain-containing protein n=1 Tax=Candidatus Spongiihabitans sp. TaxID=3101308 RepID=UPI003C6F3C75